MAPTLRILARATRSPLAIRTLVKAYSPANPISYTARRLASSDYGSGAGNPAGENPKDQGPSNSSQIEHPGPPAPDVGQGQSGSTPTKEGPGGSTYSSGKGGSTGKEGNKEGGVAATEGAAKSGETNSASDSAERSDKAKTAGGKGRNTLGSGKEQEGEEPEDVKKHNEDVKKRGHRSSEQDIEGGVDKWSWRGKFVGLLAGWVCCADYFLQDMVVLTRSLESAVTLVTTVAKSSSGVITCNIANPCSANDDSSFEADDVSIVIFVICCHVSLEEPRGLLPRSLLGSEILRARIKRISDATILPSSIARSLYQYDRSHYSTLTAHTIQYRYDTSKPDPKVIIYILRNSTHFQQ